MQVKLGRLHFTEITLAELIPLLDRYLFRGPRQAVCSSCEDGNVRPVPLSSEKLDEFVQLIRRS